MTGWRWAVRARARWARVPAAVVDMGLGVVSFAVMLVERVAAVGASMPAAIALSAVIATGLALRRRAPVTGYLIGSLGLCVEALAIAPSPVSPYANLIGIYSVGLYASRPRAWWGPALLPVGVVAYFDSLGFSSWVAPAGVVFSWVLAWALGYSTARRREEQQTAQRLMREQVLTEERARIARELHDLVGHTVNLMLVQVGAARRVLDHDQSRSRDLLSTVEAVGREALEELDRVLGVLRRDDADQPGLRDLPDLVQRLDEAGIRVDLLVDEDARDNPVSVDRSAYRIIQETLTNALKHGRANSATVSVRRTQGALVVEVCDDGRGPEPGYVPGLGLLGILERTALLGGSLQHGPAAGRGFRVRAELRVP